MRHYEFKFSIGRLLPAALLAAAGLMAGGAQAAAPGIQGPSFALDAHDGYINQPDGSQVYTWGYGCDPAVKAAPTFVPTAITGASCPAMQIPAPTLVVTEGQTVSVTLNNQLPAAAGNTSILFPGFQVTAAAAATQPSTCKAAATAIVVQGVLTQEVANGCAVTYTFVAGSPGTRSYYSGTQSDLQVEMGLYGAIIVLPATVPDVCKAGLPLTNPGGNATARSTWQEKDFRLSPAGFDHAKSCYDREYLFQFSEMDLTVHQAAAAQVLATQQSGACATGSTIGCSLNVPMEPYKPYYFLINGRSMPDDMDPNYASQYPNQPYNGNPHMHPGEQVLIRVIGQGRWQHPFHEHANHVRLLARDGNLLVSGADPTSLSGLLMFTTTTTPGQAFDGLFYFTGRGLNWDMYGHNPASPDALGDLACTPDANGYNTGAPTAVNYFEWCADHNKPLEVAPFGDVAAGGPATLPNPNIFTNGAWYGGTPYFGPDATLRASSTLRGDPTYAGSGSQGCVTGTTVQTSTTATPNCTNLQPSNIQANPPEERGWAYMWHSHNEREITTNNVFPGGMFMMMLVDSREFVIDETN